MSTLQQSTRPWDSVEYQRIVSASYRVNEVVVRFADGAEARLTPRCLVAPDVPEPDWPHLRAEDFHLVVPAPSGEIQIPWDVIRVHSDPAFDAFWERISTEPVDPGEVRRIERFG